tara:strand:- start:480 stop:989 length:510 start_codon:yes stop_codon:yes gene_type:complete
MNGWVSLGYIHLSGFKGSFNKAQEVQNAISVIQLKYDIKKIFIEENLQSFRTGLSSAKTLATLARFNGIVSYLVEDQFGIEPDFINVNAARRSVGLNLIRKSKGGAPTKEQVLDWVNTDMKSKGIIHKWPTKILKSGPRKGTEVLLPYCYDMGDAYVIAASGILGMNEK